jgi:hypothetical protein
MQQSVKALHCKMQRGIKSMIFAEIFPLHEAESHVSTLHYAGESQISLLHYAKFFT